MTSKDLSIFNSLRPFSIGFDDMFDQFENMLGNGSLTMQSNYPPYNIRKTGKDNYAIEVALAGFNKNDVEVEFEDNLLTVRTKQVNKSENNNADGEIIHKGISQRQFARSFTIADDVKVNGAELKDGLLTISCERIVPEHKKKKADRNQINKPLLAELQSSQVKLKTSIRYKSNYKEIRIHFKLSFARNSIFLCFVYKKTKFPFSLIKSSSGLPKFICKSVEGFPINSLNF